MERVAAVTILTTFLLASVITVNRAQGVCTNCQAACWDADKYCENSHPWANAIVSQRSAEGTTEGCRCSNFQCAFSGERVYEAPYARDCRTSCVEEWYNTHDIMFRLSNGNLDLHLWRRRNGKCECWMRYHAGFNALGGTFIERCPY